MVVQHNLTAMNSNRMLGLTTAKQAKSTEKLSSGYKINRAADDAAGLSISEKMRRQIRGLTQASLNAQDGISAVQTAEGALTEVHDMLQRMDELATKAANGTMSKDDRQAVQDEIDQLITEIDRVSATTKFNELDLLKGGEPDEETREVVKSPMTAKYAIDVDGEAEIVSGIENADTTDSGLYLAGSKTQLKWSEVADHLEVKDGKITFKEGVEHALYKAAADTDGEYGAQLSTQRASEDDLTAGKFSVESKKLFDKDGKEVEEEQLVDYFNEDGTYKGGLYKHKTTDDKALTEVGADQIKNYVTATAQVTEKGKYSIPTDLKFSLHVGSEADEENKIEVAIHTMSAEGIGVNVLKTSGVMTEDDATNAINTIKDAVSAVSKQRSALGAIQNRLEHTINNLDNVIENTTAAESQIRDTDMATEMVAYANNNILAQAGQAMLAQSNQANQGVLSLLG